MFYSILFLCIFNQVDYDDMNQLRQRLSTSKDQIHDMSSQFKSIQKFIGAVLQYLPPPAATTAQNIFHQADCHPQNQ